MGIVRTVFLFTLTVLAEITGCYLPWLWLRGGRPAWLLLPAAVSLALFAWLLMLHPTAAGRTCPRMSRRVWQRLRGHGHFLVMESRRHPP